MAEGLGWTGKVGPDIAPETPGAERNACSRVPEFRPK
jgi:hypothetical protein